jgi:lipoprotein LprA
MLRGVVAGTTVVGLLAIAGCGNLVGTERIAGDEFISAVSHAERSARSVAMTMRIDGPDAAAPMRMSGRMRHGGTPSDIALDLTVSGPVFPDPVSVIVVDEAMYLRMGVATGDKYAKYDLNDPSTSMGDLLGGAQLDPTAQVRGFRGAIESFEVDGTQRLDRVDTTRYRITVDTAMLLANLETTPEAVFGTGVEPPGQVTYEFWVGADRLPRRISFTIAGVTTRMDMSDWGEPVDIEPPAPEQITARDPFAQLPSLPRV